MATYLFRSLMDSPLRAQNNVQAAIAAGTSEANARANAVAGVSNGEVKNAINKWPATQIQAGDIAPTPIYFEGRAVIPGDLFSGA